MLKYYKSLNHIMSKRSSKRSIAKKELTSEQKPASKDVVVETEAAKQAKSDHIEKVWRVFRKANAEQREKLIEQLDEDTVTELRARGNPYKGNALYKRQKGDRILLFSLFSPHEKYIDRFSMTSLIGFIFRMLDEYTPEEAKQYMSEMTPEFQKVYDEIVKQYVREKPSVSLQDEEAATVARLAAIESSLVDLEVVKTPKNEEEAELSDDEDETANREAAKKSLIEERADLQKSLLETRAKAAAYTINVLSKQVEDMQPKLKSLTKDHGRHKDIRVAIKNTLRDLIDEKTVTVAQVKTVETAEPISAPAGEVVSETVEVAEAVKEETPAEKASKVATKKGAKKARSAKPVEGRPIRPHELVLSEIKSYKGKLEANGEALQSALDAVSAHQLAIDELQHALNARKEELESLQKQYFATYGSQNLTNEDKSLLNKQAAKKAAAPKQPNKGKKVKKDHVFEPHKTVFSHLKFDDVELTPEDEYNLKEKAKAQLGITMTQEECSDRILDNIEEFLYEYLVFNPDNHVKSAYKPNYKDKTRTPLKIDKKSGMILDEQFERKLVPPIDTFKRWERYREANYEQLRQATDDIYCEKSDFEWAIVPLEVFEGENAKEKADEWQRKHAKEVDFSIRSVYFNVVGLLGPWEQNRDAQNFYTKDTEVLKRMMDTHKEEERFGSHMTKERMKKKKEENAKENGSDAGLNEYLGNNPTGLEKYGAKRTLEAKDIPRDTAELKDDEVQIEVINLGAKRVGRRWKPTSDAWKFHVPAEPLTDGQVVTKNAAEFQKEQAEKEGKDN